MNSKLIEVRISKRLCSQNTKVIASEYELDQFALIHNFIAYNFPQEQRNYLFGVKNELFKLAGETGVLIYRRIIQKYFAKKNELVISHANKDKATNYFVDFFLLPEIGKILSDAALHQNIMQSITTNFKEILTNGYILPIKDILGLVGFYTKKASDNHIMQLEGEFIKQAISITKFSNSGWVDFNTKKR